MSNSAEPAPAEAKPPPWYRGPLVIWVILGAAAFDSLLPVMVLLMKPQGIGPGIGFAFLMMWVMACIWLVVVWGLVLMAALRRRGSARLVVLVLTLLPIPFEIFPVGAMIAEDTRSPPDIETGSGYFDDKANLELYRAIRHCNPRLKPYGDVCELDKVAALARGVDTAAIGIGGESQMSLAILNGGPNLDVMRIVLHASKPPDDILRFVFMRATTDRDLALLRVGLEAGLDPNATTMDSLGAPALFLMRGWGEGEAAMLEAGARVDQPDPQGYTALMRAIQERRYADAEVLLNHGAAVDGVAGDGRTMAMLVAGIPEGDREKLPEQVRRLASLHPL